MTDSFAHVDVQRPVTSVIQPSDANPSEASKSTCNDSDRALNEQREASPIEHRTQRPNQRKKKVKPPRPAVLGAGIIIIDKPEGQTSHDVVRDMRKAFHTRRVGHAGTLDPMATGVLVLGVERATKLLGLLQLETKSYSATIRLGAQTVTDDREGDILSSTDAAHITDASIQAAILPLTGKILQVPSSVSAIKVDGQRAYKLVRGGEDITLEARPVEVSRFDAAHSRTVTLPNGMHAVDVEVEVDCSSGTYIRALARDLGSALGVGGHLTELRRTRVGPFTLEDSRGLEDACENPTLSMTIDEVSQHAFPLRQVSDAEALGLSQGKWLTPVGMTGNYTVIDSQRRSIAIVRESGDRASSVFVIRPATLA